MNTIKYTIEMEINTDTKPDESSMKAIGDSAIDGIEANLGTGESITSAKFTATSVITASSERTFDEQPGESLSY